MTMAHTYASLDAIYRARAPRSRTTVEGVTAVRLPGTATTLRPVGPRTYAVRYHDTDVVTVTNRGTWTVRCGGWPTVTTTERIHTYTPADIVARDRGIRNHSADPRIELVRLPGHVLGTLRRPSGTIRFEA